MLVNCQIWVNLLTFRAKALRSSSLWWRAFARNVSKLTFYLLLSQSTQSIIASLTFTGKWQHTIMKFYFQTHGIKAIGDAKQITWYKILVQRDRMSQWHFPTLRPLVWGASHLSLVFFFLASLCCETFSASCATVQLSCSELHGASKEWHV